MCERLGFMCLVLLRTQHRQLYGQALEKPSGTKSSWERSLPLPLAQGTQAPEVAAVRYRTILPIKTSRCRFPPLGVGHVGCQTTNTFCQPVDVPQKTTLETVVESVPRRGPLLRREFAVLPLPFMPEGLEQPTAVQQPPPATSYQKLAFTLPHSRGLTESEQPTMELLLRTLWAKKRDRCMRAVKLRGRGGVNATIQLGMVLTRLPSSGKVDTALFKPPARRRSGSGGELWSYHWTAWTMSKLSIGLVLRTYPITLFCGEDPLGVSYRDANANQRTYESYPNPPCNPLCLKTSTSQTFVGRVPCKYYHISLTLLHINLR